MVVSALFRYLTPDDHSQYGFTKMDSAALDSNDLILRVIGGPEHNLLVPVKAQTSLLSSRPFNESEYASSIECSIQRSCQGVFISCANGQIQINGETCQSDWLIEGDQVQIGETKYEVQQLGICADDNFGSFSADSVDENSDESVHQHQDNFQMAENTENQAAEFMSSRIDKLEQELNRQTQNFENVNRRFDDLSVQIASLCEAISAAAAGNTDDSNERQFEDDSSSDTLKNDDFESVAEDGQIQAEDQTEDRWQESNSSSPEGPSGAAVETWSNQECDEISAQMTEAATESLEQFFESPEFATTTAQNDCEPDQHAGVVEADSQQSFDSIVDEQIGASETTPNEESTANSESLVFDACSQHNACESFEQPAESLSASLDQVFESTSSESATGQLDKFDEPEGGPRAEECDEIEFQDGENQSTGELISDSAPSLEDQDQIDHRDDFEDPVVQASECPSESLERLFGSLASETAADAEQNELVQTVVAEEELSATSRVADAQHYKPENLSEEAWSKLSDTGADEVLEKAGNDNEFEEVVTSEEPEPASVEFQADFDESTDGQEQEEKEQSPSLDDILSKLKSADGELEESDLQHESAAELDDQADDTSVSCDDSGPDLDNLFASLRSREEEAGEAEDKETVNEVDLPVSDDQQANANEQTVEDETPVADNSFNKVEPTIMLEELMSSSNEEETQQEEDSLEQQVVTNDSEQAEYKPEGVADVLARMQCLPDLDDEEPENDEVLSAAPEVEEPASMTTAEPMETAETESPAELDDNANVQDYMNSLLQRLNGEGAAQPAPQVIVRETVAEVAREEVDELEFVPPEKPMNPEEFKPKRVAPEINSNMEAMRELANATTRNAVQSSAIKRQQAHAQAQLLLAGGGIAGAAATFCLSKATGDGFFLVSVGLLAMTCVCTALYARTNIFGKNKGQTSQ